MKYRKSLKRFKKSRKSKKSKKIYGGDITEARKQMIRNQYPVGSPAPTWRQFHTFLESNIPEFESLDYYQRREYDTFLLDEHLHADRFTAESPPPTPPPASATPARVHSVFGPFTRAPPFFPSQYAPQSQ